LNLYVSSKDIDNDSSSEFIQDGHASTDL